MQKATEPVEHGIFFFRSPLSSKCIVLIARKTSGEIAAHITVGDGLRAVHQHLCAIIQLRNAIDSEQQPKGLLQGKSVFSLAQETVGVVVFDESHHA